MHTEPDMGSHHEKPSIPPKIKDIAKTIRLTGWITLWVQLVLLVVCSLSLLFASTGRDFSQQPNPGLKLGIFWGVCAILLILFSVYWNYRYTRFAKRLANPNPSLHPSKTETIKAIKIGIIASLVGILISLLGSGATLSVLVAKAVSQPPGAAITDPFRIIRAMDVLVEVANFNGIIAHFIGTVTSLWLLERVHWD